MASEYLKWKYRDVKPDEPPPERSQKEQLANWFYYNRLWIVVWAVILSIVGSIVWNMLGIGKVRPDYVFAYVGSDPLPGDCVEALERELAALGEDVNGDGSGLYYATWTAGEGQDFINADGDEAVVYDAQIYVLLEECRSGPAAQEAVGTWIAREKLSYETGEAYQKSFSAQDFELLPLISGGESNPYTHGTAAFAVREAWGISVELVCADSFAGDPQAILEQFLTGFHFSGE